MKQVKPTFFSASYQNALFHFEEQFISWWVGPNIGNRHKKLDSTFDHLHKVVQGCNCPIDRVQREVWFEDKLKLLYQYNIQLVKSIFIWNKVRGMNESMNEIVNKELDADGKDLMD